MPIPGSDIAALTRTALLTGSDEQPVYVVVVKPVQVTSVFDGVPAVPVSQNGSVLNRFSVASFVKVRKLSPADAATLSVALAPVEPAAPPAGGALKIARLGGGDEIGEVPGEQTAMPSCER